MALVDTIATFKTGTYTVTRTALATYDSKGRAVAGGTSTFPIDACAVPPSDAAQILQLRAEGYNVEDVRILYTTTRLVPASPANAPDSVVIDGDPHTVFLVVGPWQMGANVFYEARCARQRVP